MSLVRAQRYRHWSPVKYKYHWMVKPWLTACGQEVTDEWDLIPSPMDRREVEKDGCKRCDLAGEDSTP